VHAQVRVRGLLLRARYAVGGVSALAILLMAQAHMPYDSSALHMRAMLPCRSAAREWWRSPPSRPPTSCSHLHSVITAAVQVRCTSLLHSDAARRAIHGRGAEGERMSGARRPGVI